MPQHAPSQPKWNSWLELLPTAVFVLVWGVVGTGRVLWQLITCGPSRFFYAKKRAERPACMNDPALGEHKFAELKNGIKLHYVVNGPQSKPLMLFLHGFPECWFSWRYQIKEFSRDYRTVAVDMRGYGESEHPKRIADYHLGNLVEDVKQLIEYLGYNKVVLVAHDWGGNVAHWFTLLHPEMVDKFVICNMPHPKGFQKHFQRSWSQIAKSWYIMFFQIPYLPELYFSSDDMALLDNLFKHVVPGGSKAALEKPEEREAFKYVFSCDDGFTGPVNYYRAAIRYRRPVIETTHTTIPTLMIWGVQDIALEKQMAEYSKDYIKNLRLHYIQSSGHWVQQEAPDEVNKVMREYLREKQE